MPFEVIYTLIEVVAIASILYTIYKIIWYTFKMILLRSKLNKLTSSFIGIKFVRPFYKIIFGHKGAPDFIITRKGVNYEVSVVSSISTHSRWNFEKTRNHCYLEVRKYGKWFYNLYKNSADVPDHVKMYKRENKFSRHMLELSEVSDNCEKQILLLYPRPKMVTYTDTKLEYLKPGDKVLGHEIMYLEDFMDFVGVGAK